MTGDFVRYLGEFYLTAEKRYGPSSPELEEVTEVIFVALVNGGITRTRRLRLIELCGHAREVAVASR